MMELLGYGAVVAGLALGLAHEALRFDRGMRKAQAAAPATFLAAWGALTLPVRNYWDLEVA